VAWLLVVAIVLLACAATSALALRARPPPRLPPRAPGALPRVSVVVPARDEARNLPRLLASLRALEGVDAEFLVVDGGSTDGSREIALAAAREDARIRVLDEPPLPAGWVGKVWACWTGRKEARAEWLLFTDADTEHGPGSLARALAAAQDVDLLTGITRQELETFAERVAMPAVFTLIAAATRGAGEAAIRDPEHAIGNGQYLLFRASAYDRIGGHEAVKGSVVEDLALTRLATRSGLRASFWDLTDAVRVRMYRGGREMFRGWRKNVATGAAHTPALAFALTAASFSAGLLAGPLALVALALRDWPAAALLAAAWLLMAWRVRSGQVEADGPGWRHALLHPLGYAFFGAVLAASAFDRASGRGATWKGRRYPVRPR
jgi:chlorobactene glucosyltransferase